MHNFKNAHNKKAPQTSIDGIVRPRTRNGWTPAGSQLHTVRGANSLAPRQAAKDGFHAGPSLNKFTSYSPMSQPQPLESSRALKEVKEAKHKRVSRRRLPRFKAKYLLRAAIIFVISGVLIYGFLLGKAYLKARNILKGGGTGAAALQENVDPHLLKGEGDGRVNILILGRGGEGHEGPDLTDTLLLASIDPISKEAAIVSVPRDLWVQVPGYGQMKINSVFANAKYAAQYKGKTDDQAEEAGLATIQSQVATILGVPIHYHLIVDFAAFQEAIDAVGGVDVDVKTQLYDPSVAWENNWNPVIAAVGLQHMNGKKALLYARSRHGSARGDFDRTERQREVILALKDKVLSAGTFSNPLKLSQLIDAFGDHVKTDLSTDDLMRLYSIGKNISSSKITSIGLADPPNDFVTTGTVGSSSVVLPRAGTFEYSAIQTYIRTTLRDGYLKSENASVIVLNGTSVAGLATKTADTLKSYGYSVTSVGDAPTKDYTQTTLIDLTNGVKKYTKNYLEKRLGVSAKSSVPDPSITTTGVDFVIILGQNETSTE